MRIKDCLEKRYLVEETPKEDLINKEVAESDYDFKKANKAFREGDYKWTIIACYYSMFHLIKAICFKLGYREKKHFALLVILEELNWEGKLEKEYVDYFNAAIDARESANYHYNYSKEIAQHSLKIANLFNKRMIGLLDEL